MGDVVNLRRARKARARSAHQAQAAVNRAASGRSRAERLIAQADADRADRLLDGARRDPST